MINPIRLKRLKKLIERIKPYDKTLAYDIEKMVYSIEIGFHNGKSNINESVSSAIKKVKDLNIDMCVIGGLAVRHWVNIRTTDDIDFVVLSDYLDDIRLKFPNGKNSVLGYSVKIDGTNVDFLSSSNFLWAKESIENADNGDILGIKIKIAKPEYLLLFKIESSRNIDLTDILALLTIDDVANKTRDLIYKYLPTSLEDFEQYVVMAEHGIF